MAKTKNINQTAPIEPEDIEEPESNGDKPKPKRPTRPIRTEDSSRADLELRKDLLARLSSKELDDLKQLSDVPLKLIDPISKGMAYYDATQKTIRTQCSDLLDFYIEKCDKDIQRYTELKARNLQESLIVDDPKDKRFLSSLFRNAKEAFLPNLQPIDIDGRLTELEKTKDELAVLKEINEVIIEKPTYFKSWSYNYYLNRRSLEHLLLDGHVALTDAQILNRGDDGGMERMRDIFKR